MNWRFHNLSGITNGTGTSRATVSGCQTTPRQVTLRSAFSLQIRQRLARSATHNKVQKLDSGSRRVRCSLCVRAQKQVNGACINVSVVLLAGGSGKRMGAPIPKQYLELLGQPIAIYSLQIFASMPEVTEMVIVCNSDYRDLFQQHYDKLPRKPKLTFAEPGSERQDSVYNGFQAIGKEAALVAIHDSARPLITPADAQKCIQDAWQIGAAVLGVPVKPTIKEVHKDGTVVKTLERANLWEVQTPQVIKPSLLQAGFELVARENLEVTDDVSIIEALGEPVKLTRGSYTNIKVTTPDDLLVAEGFMRERKDPVDVAALS